MTVKNNFTLIEDLEENNLPNLSAYFLSSPKPLKWEEVFLFWYKCEGKRQNWIDLARKNGFTSWSDWRLTSYAIPFGCASADWNLYEVANADQLVLDFHGGPFKSWIKRYYDGKKEKTFNEIVEQSDITNNQTIQNIVKDFPVDKIIICLEVNGKIYTIEGMHRCCALAIINKQQINIAPQKVYFAIGKSSLKELPIAF